MPAWASSIVFLTLCVDGGDVPRRMPYWWVHVVFTLPHLLLPLVYPINRATTFARHVRRPRNSATPGRRAAKTRTAHAGAPHRHRTTRMRRETAAPSAGRSFRVRTYALWRECDTRPQVGQAA
jgi:hypothetical protein